MSAKLKHPPPSILRAFALGQLIGDHQAKVERHVSRCGRCAGLLDDAPDDTFLARLRGVAATTEPPDPLPPRETQPGGVSSAELPPGLRDHPRYRVTRRLGAGGMGVVYLAEHRVMERPVALKVIHPSLVGSRRAVERFRREVKAAARLAHRNIVAALDAERAEGAHFLVMEYVQGMSLDRVVASHGPLPIGHACAYIRQAAQGLQHAHERGMSHRDVKPQNLMLTRAGLVKVLDFGLARFAADTLIEASGASGEVGAPSIDGLTRTGSALGTPAYMAPEQALDASRSDIRSDLYGLGATLFFLLTGRPPFDLPSAEALFRAHRKEPAPPPSSVRKEVPPELDAVVLKLLAKRPEDRHATPGELAEALSPFRDWGTPLPGEPSAAHDPFADLVLERETALPSRPNRVQKPRRARTRARTAGLTLLVLLAAITVGIFARNWSSVGGDSATARQANLSPPARAIEPSTAPRESGAPEIAVARPRLRLLLVAPRVNLWYPDYGNILQALRDLRIDAEVRVASSLSTQPLQTQDHPPIPVDLILTPEVAPNFDAVVFLGGNPPLSIEYVADPRQHATAFRLIATARKAGVPIAGLCGGAAVLAKAGALDGIDCARSPYILETLEQSGASRLLDQPVVISRDHAIVTARDPDAAWDLMTALVQTLKARGKVF